MNQYGTGSRTFLVRLAAAPDDGRTVSLPSEAAAALERGARLLFYEQRGEAANPKASLTGWGSIERLTPDDTAVTITLRDYVAFRPRIPFADLRSDPRRNRDAEVQPITAEVFNAALAKARR
jgi:hypothetical protein